MTMVACFFLFTPNSDLNKAEDRYIQHSTSLIRLTFVLIYIIMATAFVIDVLVKHEINYMYIFELDPLAKMNHHQLLKVGMVLSFVWSICFSMSLMQARLEYIFGQ